MSLITSIWMRQSGDFFCVCTRDASGKWREHFFEKERVGELDAFVKHHQHSDQYFCPHGFSRRERKKRVAVAPKMLWADLDQVNPKTLGPLKPTIAIESSPDRFVGLWITDKPIEEDLNRRLTYKLGADRGGWDLTQVLRIPGTTNYKYRSTPRVKLLWDDGPVYRVADVERIVGQAKAAAVSGDGRQIFEKYRKRVPYWVRNELFTGRPVQGKRSDMLWKLEHALMEVGAERHETLAMIKASPWNKFAGRSSEDEQLEREMDKVYQDQEELVNGYGVLSRNMAEVEEENVDWLWYPYLARREVTIIEGDPGEGKSYLAQFISKCLVDGIKLPSTKRYASVQGKVAYFDVENNASTVTKKRLKYNNCKNMKDFYQEEEPFSIDDKKALEEVYEALERLRPIMIVFDTINLYIGSADTGKASETTQALAVFKDMAKRFNCSVLVLRHLTKGNSKEKALYRGQGNIAFTGVSRIVITVGKDPDDPTLKVMAMTKLNLAKTPQALTFSVDELPDTLRETDRSVFKFHGFRGDLTSDDILRHEKSENSTAKEDAEEFIREALADGPVEYAKLERMARGRSISQRTLQRASDKLVEKITKGFGQKRVSLWQLSDGG